MGADTPLIIVTEHFVIVKGDFGWLEFPSAPDGASRVEGSPGIAQTLLRTTVPCSTTLPAQGCFPDAPSIYFLIAPQSPGNRPAHLNTSHDPSDQELSTPPPPTLPSFVSFVYLLADSNWPSRSRQGVQDALGGVRREDIEIATRRGDDSRSWHVKLVLGRSAWRLDVEIKCDESAWCTLQLGTGPPWSNTGLVRALGAAWIRGLAISPWSPPRHLLIN